MEDNKNEIDKISIVSLYCICDVINDIITLDKPFFNHFLKFPKREIHYFQFNYPVAYNYQRTQ